MGGRADCRTDGSTDGRGGPGSAAPSAPPAPAVDGRAEGRALGVAAPRAFEGRARKGAKVISGSSPRQSFQASVTIGGRSGRAWKMWSNSAMLTTLPAATPCKASRASASRSSMNRSSLSLGMGPLRP
jgi:hypothetical protein